MKGVEGERFYFVHSFAAMSAAPADTSGDPSLISVTPRSA